ncbi:MAG: hypothetical protein V4558_06700 [Gemmatimonadota bacterium]
MTWLTSFLVGVLTAVVALFVTGFVASLAVDWYRISSFEGGAGYFVVFLALGGMIAGFIVGIVTARMVAAGAHPGFLRAQGFSLLVVGVLALTIGGVARLLADVPPTIDGEEVMLVVEARWPADQGESPATVPGLAYLELGSVNSSHVQRLSRRGALWKEDARLIDGRWTVTGAIPLFTSRGTPSLDIALNDSLRAGFILPFTGSPSKKAMAWSEWLPREGRGGPPRATGVNYRYRVQKISEPVRTENFGPFAVSAIISSFSYDAAPGTTTLDADATFRLAFQGKPARFASDSAASDTPRVDMVAALAGAQPALLALVAPESATAHCSILLGGSDAMREVRIGECSQGFVPEEITNDNARFLTARAPKVPRGRLDRQTWSSATWLLFPNDVLDTRSMTLHHFTATTDASIIPAVPPLGISPDERSFVRYTLGYTGGESEPLLRVTDVVADRAYQVRVDPIRMRYPNLESLDPNWLAHHFRWQRGHDGVDSLVARTDFVPIPYHGVVTTDTAGLHDYRIEKAGPAVRQVLVEFLEKSFKGERQPADSGAYEFPMKIDGQTVNIANSGDFDYVLVSLAREEKPSDLVLRIAKAFDAALATGRYDAAFVPKSSSP